MPPFWRETAAALISPPVGFNRLAFGDRFRTIFPGNDPVYFSRLEIGASRRVQNSAGLSTAEEKPNEALIDYSIDYGDRAMEAVRYVGAAGNGARRRGIHGAGPGPVHDGP